MTDMELINGILYFFLVIGSVGFVLAFVILLIGSIFLILYTIGICSIVKRLGHKWYLGLIPIYSWYLIFRYNEPEGRAILLSLTPLLLVLFSGGTLLPAILMPISYQLIRTFNVGVFHGVCVFLFPSICFITVAANCSLKEEFYELS